VYLVDDLVTRRQIALKLIRPELLDAESIEGLKDEFRAIASLRHPRIASAIDFGYTQDDSIPFYTPEYTRGMPLPPGPIDLEGQTDPEGFVRPILDLLDALHYLHSHDILHLDVHAGNLIVPDDPTRDSQLIDVGVLIPRLDKERSRRAEARLSLAPEPIGDEPVGPFTDIYAVGRLLLSRLTGRYQGEAKLPRQIPGWGSRLVLELERIITKSTHPDPAFRFESAEEFRRSLATAFGKSEHSPAHAEPGETTVGRNREIAIIEAAIRDACAGQSRCVWLRGPLGIGKSRLMTEARWRAQLRGLDVVSAHFLPERGTGLPLTRTLEGAPGDSSWLSPLSTEHGGSTEERARRSARAYFASEGPAMVLLLDDVDDVDPESLALALALAAACH
jgi:serine/threonine protein kinase